MKDISYTSWEPINTIQNIAKGLFTCPNVCTYSVNMMVHQNNVIQGLRTSVISNEKHCFHLSFLWFE